jgi:hypothetical protein
VAEARDDALGRACDRAPVGGSVLRGLDAHTLDLSALPAERRRFQATIGRRSTAQALARREPERRYPILLALVAQCAVEVLDKVVQLFDQALSATDHRAERKLEENRQRARRGGL